MNVKDLLIELIEGNKQDGLPKCPNHYGLNEDCLAQPNCKACWLEALDELED